MTELASKPDFPAGEHDISPPWMSLALAGRFPGVRVAALDLTKRIDGTATKLRYGLSYRVPADAAGAPSSLWLKCGFDSKGAKQGEAFANEVNFFRDIAPLLFVNVPDCYFGAIDPATRDGVVLLEDLVARGATFGQASQSLTADRVAAILSLQARYHACFWQSPRLEEFRWLKAGGAIADTGMVDQYMGLWDLAVPLPRFRRVPPGQRDKKRMRDALAALMQTLRENPLCLVHGDAHSANLYFDRDGRPGYLDWQHVMRGHWAFDLASVLITALTVADRRAHERALLQHYLKELAAHGAAAPDADRAWHDYRRFAMWPFMWVMCPPTVHPEATCTLNAERACTAIADLETLEAIEGDSSCRPH